MNDDLVFRLRKRAEIRRQIATRKSVQNNEPDRISDLLEEASDRIVELEERLAFLEDKAVMVDNTEAMYKFKYLYGDDLLEAQKRINNMLRKMVDDLPNKDKP